MSKSDRLLGDYQDKLIRKNLGYEVESDDDDELLEQLENDSEFDRFREQRIQELSELLKTAKQSVAEGGGNVETLLSEEQVLQKTTSTRQIVLHFTHPDFQKCKVMDEKLSVLAQKHLGTKFIRIDVDNAPFLVTRLQIKVLPVVILYINGVESNRLVGFDKLNFNESGDFQIESLEKFLLENGVIERKANSYKRVTKKNANDDDYESDLDL